MKSLLLMMRGPLLGESVDGAFVDRAEDYSESLANQLHALSLAVREKKIDELASYFAAGLSAGGLPVRRDVAHPANKSTVAWNADWSSDGLDREAFVGEWCHYLGYFSAIEDVRFKVKQAHFIEGEAVQAEAWIEATLQPEGRWLLDAFELEKHGAHVALTELFSEVSLPAGMFRSAPRFGTPGNQDFLAHGVAVADIDRDGWIDVLATGVGRNFLYITRATVPLPSGHPQLGSILRQRLPVHFSSTVTMTAMSISFWRRRAIRCSLRIARRRRGRPISSMYRKRPAWPIRRRALAPSPPMSTKTAGPIST